ncbi:hypothetical protein DZC72_10245 [Maribacter algicola]|uniref:Lipocalin-like domain-containing protein n=1 Tax=Maribacter algicola TaxID=2498892 RepID=A0A426RGJ1_9FLAO|nr:hypothetical protein [Maribacter algicola]RRQ48102.1 hypothetical protein DZC72_10245 [Maribacter algicola]
MKYFLPFILFFAFVGCDNDSNEINPTESKILGSWKMVRQQYSIGGPPFWEEVLDGEILEFQKNFVFKVVKDNSESGIGIFDLRNDSLIRTFSNDTDSIKYISQIQLKGNKMLLIPVSPNRCIEGCSFEYLKME